MNRDKTVLHIGIDIGSTTTKIAALDTRLNRVVHSDYQRHHAGQVKGVAAALGGLADRFPDAQYHLAMTGSGAKKLADRLGQP